MVNAVITRCVQLHAVSGRCVERDEEELLQYDGDGLGCGSMCKLLSRFFCAAFAASGEGLVTLALVLTSATRVVVAAAVVIVIVAAGECLLGETANAFFGAAISTVAVAAVVDSDVSWKDARDA